MYFKSIQKLNFVFTKGLLSVIWNRISKNTRRKTYNEMVETRETADLNVFSQEGRNCLRDEMMKLNLRIVSCC